MSSQIIWPESQTIDGLELELTCASHPEQYDVYEGDVQVAYFRLRCGRFSVAVPDCGGEIVYMARPEGSDMFNDDERQKYLEEAVRAVRRSQRPAPVIELPVEAKVAAKWWADRLRHGAKQQMVSPNQRALENNIETDICEVLIMLAGRDRQVLSAEQIDNFEMILGTIIDKRYIKSDHWEKAKVDPNWGSAVRIIQTDYAACDELRAAFQAAGGVLDCSSVFPIKTTMWIGPGSVKVSYGYGAKQEELMAK